MKMLNMAERTKEEDYESRKKEALDFLERVRAIREKKDGWLVGQYAKD